MKVKDTSGREYSVSVAGSALTGSLPGRGALKLSEYVRRYVAFEIPVTSEITIFKYGGPVIRVDISLIE